MAQSESLADKLARLRAASNATTKETSIEESEPEKIEESKAPEKELSLVERLALLKKKPNTVVQSKEIAPVKEKVEEKKSSLAVMGAALRQMPALKPEDHERAPAEVHSLRARIWELQKESLGSNLKNCMQELQIALLENPTAVSFMLPEDYKEMVHHVRKLVGNSVAVALSKPATKGGKAKSASQANKNVPIEVNLDDLSF